MRFPKMTSLGSFAAVLALALSLPATPIDAQPPAQRGQRGGPDAAPVQRGPVDAAPVRRGAPDQPGPRGPVDASPVARGPMDFGPGAPGGPAAGLVADVTPFWERPMVTERMSLTDEQLKALKASYEKARPAIDINNTKMREAGQKIATAMNADGEPDLTEIRKAINDFTTAQNATMIAAVEHRAVVQKTLNAEQLANLRQMRQRVRVPGQMMDRPGSDMPGEPGVLPDLPNRGNRDGARRDMPEQRDDMTPEARQEMRDRMREARERRTTE